MSTNIINGNEARSRPRKKRASVACQACHSRKVRCNVIQCGVPCWNCQQDGSECTIVPRKKPRKVPTSVTTTKRLRRGGKPPPSIAVAIQPATAAEYPTVLSISRCTPGERHVSEEGAQSEFGEATESLNGQQQDANRTQPSQTHGDASHSSETDEGDNPTAFNAAMNSEQAEDSLAPFYAGENHVMSFVLDVCDNTRPSHYLVPRAAMQSVPQEDLALLRTKGVFTLPSPSICEQLLHCYFRYIHPFLPILDAGSFLAEYQEHGIKRVNLLLLWSVFFAASNFVKPELLQDSGFRSRKALKRSMYQKAKALYDVDYEKDKIVLIQAVILLAYWYVDAEDRTGTWHWLGVAIALCHSIGLHRSPQKLPSTGTRYSKERYSLWRLIWWSLYQRETWVSFGLGRPMRINLKDSDVPMPTAEDILLVSGSSSYGKVGHFMPKSMSYLAQYWLKYLHLSMALEQILKCHYRPGKNRRTTSDIDKSRNILLKCFQMNIEPAEMVTDPDLQLFSLQLELFERNVFITLYRPYILVPPSDLSTAQHRTWRSTFLGEVLDAASKVNMTLIKLSQLDSLSVCQSSVVQAISPAMQMHLYEAFQPNSLSSQMGFQQLDVCMTVLKEFRKTYWAADFSLRIFSEALLKVPDRTKRRRYEHGGSCRTDPQAPDSADQTSSNWSGVHCHQSYESPDLVSGPLEAYPATSNENIFSSLDLDFFKFAGHDQSYDFDLDWGSQGNSLLCSEDFLELIGTDARDNITSTTCQAPGLVAEQRPPADEMEEDQHRQEIF